MPLAGFEAANGAFSLTMAVLIGTLGSALGGAAWYVLARRLGSDRFGDWADKYGRWLTISSAEVKRGEAWFRRWGAMSVFVGRALPGVRGVICVPAGLAGMSAPRFLLWSTLGALVWTAFLAAAGYVLKSNYSAANRWIGPLGGVFVLVCVGAYGVRLVRSSPKS